MNILYILHYYEMNGSIRSTLDLAKSLRAYNISSFFIVPRSGMVTDYLSREGIPFRVVPVPFWMERKTISLKVKYKRTQEIFQSALRYQNLIDEWHIDLVYTNTSLTPVGRLAALRASIPHIWHIREFFDLHFSLHYLYPESICRKFIKSSDAVFFNSVAVRKHFEAKSCLKSTVIYNGIKTRKEFDVLYDRAASKSENETFTFLIIGSIFPKKGQEAAIDAFSKVIKNGFRAKLLICGSGRENYVSKVKEKVERLGLQDCVEFEGFIYDPYDAYFRSDCLLMCSDFEAFGRVSAEAMSACLPVIGKNSGGTPEVVVDGKTGILYDTEEELETAMIWMVQHPAEASQMGLAGWKRAKELFNIEDCAAKVFEIIQSVTKQA
jgi:glycosyltransferase involved in cell wall biosynthesis